MVSPSADDNNVSKTEVHTRYTTVSPLAVISEFSSKDRFKLQMSGHCLHQRTFLPGMIISSLALLKLLVRILIDVNSLCLGRVAEWIARKSHDHLIAGLSLTDATQ